MSSLRLGTEALGRISGSTKAASAGGRGDRQRVSVDRCPLKGACVGLHVCLRRAVFKP